jgi:hypothetical protein
MKMIALWLAGTVVEVAIAAFVILAIRQSRTKNDNEDRPDSNDDK